MKNLLISSALRMVKAHIGSFIAILLIIAVGASLFAGTKAAQLDMLDSVDEYFDKNKLMDVRLTSVNGFADDDINTIKEQFDCTIVPSYYVESEVTSGKTNFTASIISYSKKVNLLTLTKGRLPKSADECVVSADSQFKKLKIGDEISVKADTTGLKSKKFKVVGLYKSAANLSEYNLADSKKGVQKVGNILYVNSDAFSLTRANQLYMRMDFLRENSSYTGTYIKAVKNVIERAQTLSKTQLESIQNGGIDLRTVGLENINPQLSAQIDNLYALYDEVLKQQDELNKTKKSIDELGVKLSIAYDEYDIAANEADRGESESQKAEEEYKKGIEAVTNKETELAALKHEITTKSAERDSAKTVYDTAVLELGLLTEGTDEHTAKKTEVDTLKADLDAKTAAVSELEKQATQMQADIDAMKAQYQSKLDNVKENLKTLLDSEIKSEEQLKELEKIYNEAYAEYEIKKSLYNEQATDINNQLADVRNSVFDIFSKHKTLWTGNGRYDLSEYKSFKNQAASLGLFGISGDKKLMLLLVITSLLSFIPIAVFVNKQSKQIGLLKAMGIDGFTIWLRLTLGCVLATAIGCIVGCSIGFEVVSPMIINASGDAYNITAVVSGFSASAFISALVTTLVCATVFVTLLCIVKLRKSPASLINNKPEIKNIETENADID